MTVWLVDHGFSIDDQGDLGFCFMSFCVYFWLGGWKLSVLIGTFSRKYIFSFITSHVSLTTEAYSVECTGVIWWVEWIMKLWNMDEKNPASIFVHMQSWYMLHVMGDLPPFCCERVYWVCNWCKEIGKGKGGMKWDHSDLTGLCLRGLTCFLTSFSPHWLFSVNQLPNNIYHPLKKGF